MNGPSDHAPRTTGSRRWSAVVGTLLFLVAAGAVLTAAARAASVPTTTPLAMLVRDHAVRTAPSAHAHRITIVSSRRPLTGTRTVLPVVGHVTTGKGRHWLHVQLPGRPNGLEGWISATRTLPISTPWRLSVKLGARRVTVYYLGHVLRRFSAVVGAPSTPTPRGRFFIEEAMSLGSQAGGPFALASSARSDVLQDFDGGPGQIALHGMNQLSGALGTAASHGCIRMSTFAITWLSQRIGAGIPLTITY